MGSTCIDIFTYFPYSNPMLNPNAPIPLYQQLADRIAEQIRSGVYPPGAKIPSEHQLAQEHKIGRPTVRQALDALVKKGLIQKRRGAGTFVKETPKEVDLLSLAGTSSAFLKRGIQTKPKILRPLKRRTVQGQDTNPFEGKEAYSFTRLTLAEDLPVLIEAFYLDPDVFHGIDEIDMRGRSLSEVVEDRFYLRPIGGRQTFRIATLQGTLARYLGVTEDTPLLQVHRTLDFPVKKSALFAEIHLKTDVYVFSQEIGGPHHG